MRHLVKHLIPPPILKFKRKLQLAALRRRYSRMAIEEVFSEIYESRLWGADEAGTFCSGSGSRGHVASAYAAFVRTFIIEHNIRSVADLGCGDFAIGSEIAKAVDHYVGVDVVPELIEYLKRKNRLSGVEFRCVNIVDDELPGAQLCLIRQVFQHLSNQQILNVVRKLGKYEYVMVTEHYPAPYRVIVPNKDKPHGPDTRLLDDSAVYLDKPPFGLVVQEVLSAPAVPFQIADGETLRTFLIRHGL